MRASTFVAPRVPSRVPVLGCSLELATHPDRFLRRCRDRHGSAFSVPMLGGRRIFLVDPFDARPFFQNEALSFSHLSLELGGRVFGFDAGAAKTRWRIAELESLYALLHGDELAPLTERMRDKLAERLHAAVGPRGHEGELFRFTSEHVFAAGMEALFGDGAHSAERYQAFRTVDRFFGPLALGAPVALLPGVRRAQLALAAHANDDRPHRSRLLNERAAHFAALGLPQAQRNAMQAAILWASQSNTVAAAFWTVFFILRDATARAAILAETRQHGGAGLTSESLKKMRLLDSAISEALRLTSLGLSMRRAEQPTRLTLDSGRTLELQQGELICIFPRLTHLDPEIYPAPDTFRFDRFFDDASDGPRAFYKGGRRVLFPLMPFGGGANACPGRFFARNEFKLIAAILLTEFDLDILTPEVPEIDFSRVGFGIPPPRTDVRFRIRRR